MPDNALICHLLCSSDRDMNPFGNFWVVGSGFKQPVLLGSPGHDLLLFDNNGIISVGCVTLNYNSNLGATGSLCFLFAKSL